MSAVHTVRIDLTPCAWAAHERSGHCLGNLRAAPRDGESEVAGSVPNPRLCDLRRPRSNDTREVQVQHDDGTWYDGEVERIIRRGHMLETLESTPDASGSASPRTRRLIGVSMNRYDSAANTNGNTTINWKRRGKRPT